MSGYSLRKKPKDSPRSPKAALKQPPPCVVCFTPMKPMAVDVWRCPNHERHVKNGLL